MLYKFRHFYLQKHHVSPVFNVFLTDYNKCQKIVVFAKSIPSLRKLSSSIRFVYFIPAFDLEISLSFVYKEKLKCDNLRNRLKE